MPTSRDNIDEIVAAIIASLTEGAADARGVAGRLGMSGRTMQRKLADRGTTFSKLLEDVRREAAQTMLRETDMSLAEIAESLAYTELGSFSRAFRDWSGMSPSAYRACARRECDQGRAASSSKSRDI